MGKPLKEKKLDRDFISMNKAATRAGLVTAKEHFQYRATHEVAPLKKEREVKCKSGKELPNINTVYGVPTKPSTPVFDLLEHKYQDKWLEEIKMCEDSKVHKKSENSLGRHKSYGETRASRLRRYSPPVDPPPLWQMSKFQKMPSQHCKHFGMKKSDGRHLSTMGVTAQQELVSLVKVTMRVPKASLSNSFIYKFIILYIWQ